MKVRDAINYSNVIKSIIDNATDVSALVKFKLLGMAKQLQPIVDNFDTVRNENIYKYGVVNEDGGASIVEPKRETFETDEEYNDAVQNYKEVVTKVNVELKNVLNTEVDVKIDKFKYNEIIDAGVSANYLLQLYELIEE